MAKCKYYKKQRYVSYNDGLTWEALNEFERGDLYETNSPSCSDGSTQFQWVELENSSMCDGKNRYAKEVQQISYDGEYWYNVFPTTYRKGRLLEANSQMCDNAGGGQYDSGGTQPTSGESETTTDCPEGYDLINGVCVCRTAMDDDGNCIVCQDYENFNTETRTCECNGRVVDGVCLGCPPNSTWNSTRTECVCKHWYEKQPDGTCLYVDPLKITKCEGEDGILTQSEVDYYRTGWTLTSYVIGDCIDTISANTFNGQLSLTSVTIPNTVTSIGRLAFGNCRSLTNITIPSGVTYLGDNLFVDCASLTYADMQCSLSAVPFAMFANCMSLVSADWLSYNNIESIGNKAFINCYSLTSATFNQALQTIGDNAFERCTSIMRIDIPSGVTSIGKYAFSQCNELTSVTINSSAVTINEGAFFNCKKLMKIVFTSNTPPTLSGSALSNINESCIFIVPCEAEQTYKTAWSQYADRIQCNDTNTFYRWAETDGIYCIDTDAYTRQIKQQTNDGTVWTNAYPIEYREKDFITHYSPDCGYSGDVAITVESLDGFNRYYEPCSGDMTITTAITSAINQSVASKIILNDCVTAIDDLSFYGFDKVSSVYLSDNITSIGQAAFGSCSGITSVELSSGLTSIGNSAFDRCRSLTSIIIPSGTTSIGDYAFYLCSDLNSVTVYATTPPSLGSRVFDGADNSLIIYVPYGYVDTYKAASGWSDYSNRIQVIPFKVASNQNGNYKSVYCNSSTTLTRTEVFGISSLYYNDVVIGDCVTVIDSLVFMNAGMSSVTFSNSVTTIRNAAFYECTKLTSITIPNSVTLIAGGAFYNCSGLTSITVNATTPPTLGSNAFDNTNDCPIIVPTQSVNAFKTAWPTYADRIQGLVDKKLVVDYNDSTTYEKECDSSSVLTSSGINTYKSINAYVGNCVTTLDATFSACDNLTSVTLSDSVAIISGYAFNNCTSLTGITLPSGVTYIGDSAFNSCSSLSSITIPSGVTNIGNSAFRNCISLTTLSIHNGVTNIDNAAFYSCSGLTNVTIGTGITSIGSWAFMACTSLSSITINATTPPSLGTNALFNTNNCYVYVPASSVSAYQSASDWSDYASRLQAIPT